MPEEAEGRDTLGNGINFVDRCWWWPRGRRGIAINVVQAAESMPRRLYLRA
jgi:hypothetical protein